MSLFINTNTAAANAANSLANSNILLQNSLNKLSSGSAIVKASDNAGGLAASMGLTVAANNTAAVVSQDNNEISFLQAQDGVLKTAGDIATRIAQLNSLAGDPTMTATDVAGYNTESNTLVGELGTLAGMQFNGTNLFGTAMNGTTVTLTNGDSVSTIAASRALNGAAQSALQFDSQANAATETNLQAASGQISNVDVASESTNLAKFNVMVQYGAAMLAQANQTTQVALKLIQ
jgi:flagellin